MNDGGSAFPKANDTDRAYGGNDGMSLRDYFAAKAMQSLLDKFIETLKDPQQKERIIAIAYAIADAMLKEREKGH